MEELKENGFDFNGHTVPGEILYLILSHVNIESLPYCRLVCRVWRDAIDSEIWRHKLDNSVYKKLKSKFTDLKVPFYAYYKLYKHDPFNKNLIRNPSGEEQLGHWKIIKNGGDGWLVEHPPCGINSTSHEDTPPISSCFATSFTMCVKEQRICLSRVGATSVIMDTLKPTIEVSEWYAGRFDCACTYFLKVLLLNEQNVAIEKFVLSKSEAQWEGGDWHKVYHEFKNYPEGVRYIVFEHSGHDRQFWKGHYGSKMTDASVRLLI